AGAIAGWIVGRPINVLLGAAFRAFNAGFARATSGYIGLVGKALRISMLALVVYGGLLFLTYWSFSQAPKGFIPSQDKGYLLVNIQLPDSASMERTQAIVSKIEAIAGKSPGVKHTVAIAGESALLNANAPNFASMYLMLEEFHVRGPALSADAIGRDLQVKL